MTPVAPMPCSVCGADDAVHDTQYIVDVCYGKVWDRMRDLERNKAFMADQAFQWLTEKLRLTLRISELEADLREAQEEVAQVCDDYQDLGRELAKEMQMADRLAEALAEARTYVAHRQMPKLCDGLDCYIDSPHSLITQVDGALGAHYSRKVPADA